MRSSLSWAIAIPVTVAADLLLVLLAAWFVPLEQAVIIVRVAWFGGALASFLAVKWKNAPAARFGLRNRELWITAAAGAGALAVSLALSRAYMCQATPSLTS